VISSRRRDQIPDPDADGTPGIASPPSPPCSTQKGPPARSVAHPIPAAEDDDSACGPRRMRRRRGPPSCGRVGSTAAVERGDSREGFSETGRRRRCDARRGDAE